MHSSVALSPTPEASATSTPKQGGASSLLVRRWRLLWFQDRSTSPLEIARIGIAAAMLLHFALASPYLFMFWGDGGWVSRQALEQMTPDPWVQSVFFYFTAPWQWVAFHAVFLFCCAALAVGWRTSWVKWLVLIGHISYGNRNPSMTYGVHAILSCLLLILCFAPIGRGLSLDRVREVRAAKRKDLDANPPAFTSCWAFACTRLMQIQMALLFFFSGAHKLRGDEWWSGDAVWKVFAYDDYYNSFILDVFASQYWLANIATYGTILIELAYPFLIWQRRTRPYLLSAAIFLHLMFGLLLRLIYFSSVMIVGHLSFLRPEWLTRLGELIGHRTEGAVLAATAFLIGDDGLLLLAVEDVLVDGQRLEGVGVTPTIEVPFDWRYAAGGDPQLDRAVQVLARS